MIRNLKRPLQYLTALLISFLLCNPSQARTVRLIVTRTESYMDGKIFGVAGPYVKISGQAYGEVDPDNPLNSIIQDIKLAPVNERGGKLLIHDNHSRNGTEHMRNMSRPSEKQLRNC